MSLVCTIYAGETGAYLKTVTAPDIAGIDLNTPEGAIIILGEHPEDTYLRAGNVTVMPPRPTGSGWQFDYQFGLWRDLRTDLDRQVELYAARAATAKDKTDLLLALSSPDIGILSVEEAIIAVQGQIPPSFEGAFASLPPAAQGIARIKWAGDMVINRTNPLILLAAHAAGISDEVLDVVFGVAVPT